ncbi:DUF4214 domain-containing protein [Cellulomonas fimi]|uniref:DUF4214 domain-containing protein n=1 Tax=Cellulomonas fimi TaxID=1708 RepID=A0A7Y0QI16_CELFI|nr:DUF4214 domain-containing protein [Cellulomonas fimi]NMR20865.1 DUF4214 domain-containing protein [Cellulomonas fimi]
MPASAVPVVVPSLPLHPLGRAGRRLLVSLLAAVLVLVPAFAPPARGAEDEITFTGYGWGHGRGMGQYGALGYAVDYGWGYEQILAHFYGGTTPGDVGNRVITVELMDLVGKPLTAIARGLTINGGPWPDANVDGSSVRVTPQGGTFLVETGATCAGPWTVLGTAATVTLGTTSQSGFDRLIRVCEAAGERAYRGQLVVQRHAQTGVQLNLNRVSVEDYLRGVVPRESPAFWGDLGGGRGMHALRAQAVAARSYALSGTRPSGATTCDTITCQVYRGAAFQPWSQPREILDAANTNRAIDDTRGQVRYLSGGTTIARTEFSSSTGGYTAGGQFPPVVDLGDSIASNPNHTWTTAIGQATVAARLGVSGIASMAVTARNGLGADGGRVTQVRVTSSTGQARTFTGNEVRSLLGLKSDWFSLSFVSRAEAQQVVKALYQDVLGRSVDPSGLQTWTDLVVRTGSARDLATGIVTSRERMINLVTAQYRSALRRDPEPGGLENWVAHLEAGRGVYDLQIGIYGSQESLLNLGGGNVQTWVGALYQELLGRAGAPSELQFWVNHANRYGRPAVVAGIAQSDESTIRRLNAYYRTFMQRDVDPAGRATFLPMMTARGDFDVPISLGSSPEYWTRAQSRTF